ncbi:hypothetical protein CAC42_451 [Sphaceloma murrayae]|uniref:Uncharacterized protein n=1 Tax=Sphaceloma murrayae TaxID=2082308 RepID=A0A2K1R3U0_9PEZI|nr:hypothetical protein CAC42_451 [Sphaceloma murrayae]
MSRAGLTINPRTTEGGDVAWSVINTGCPAASEVDEWNHGERLDFAEGGSTDLRMSWFNTDLGPDIVQGDARGKRLILIRSIHVGDWVLVRYTEDGVKGQEFAKVCAIRMCGSGRKKVCKLCLSWGYAIESAAERHRSSSARTVMDQAGVTTDCVVPSNHFDIVGLDMVDDVVLEKADGRGVITTLDYGLHRGVTVLVDILDGLWLNVTDLPAHAYQLKVGNIIQ